MLMYATYAMGKALQRGSTFETTTGSLSGWAAPGRGVILVNNKHWSDVESNC
jgi:hypothetical protein